MEKGVEWSGGNSDIQKYVGQYQGFWFCSDIVRPTDQEMTDIEKILCFSQFPKGGSIPCHIRPDAEATQLVRGRRRGEHGQKPLLYLLSEEMSKVR